MTKFIVLYKMPKTSNWNPEDNDPEAMQAEQAKWMAWAEKCGEGLVDMGSPLGNGHQVGSDENGTVESSVGGYSVLQAESMDEAMKLLEGHPHLGWGEGCEIEVYECMPMGG